MKIIEKKDVIETIIDYLIECELKKKIKIILLFFFYLKTTSGDA